MNEPAAHAHRPKTHRDAIDAQRMHDLNGGVDVAPIAWDDDNSPIVPPVIVPG
jgi:hypothetical protein